MSRIATTYCSVAKIELGKVVAWKNENDELCFAQDIDLTMDDGTKTDITLHLSKGCHALQLADVITPEFDARVFQAKA